MNRETSACHVIKDPIHGTMQFTRMGYRWIKPFIDSAGFQRLRHIKQMGMSDYIFPGAVHTRFNHCLGCCYIASQIAYQLQLSDEERQWVMIAGLLHDIGHGPFSHAFEDLFHNRLIRHEAWTPFFLADYSSDAFLDHYNAQNPEHTLTPEKLQTLSDIIMHRAAGTRLLADIVSSQLDADRLDYLLRDSHFCGVTYGEFDIRWMLNSMTVINTPGGERLGVTHKGIGVVEHYLMARRLMTRNICHHPKKIALEYYLVQLLSRLAASLEDFDEFAEIRATLPGKFLLAANRFNQAARISNDHDTLVQQFLQQQYVAYRELCDYDIFAVIRQLASMTLDHDAVQLAKRIHHRRIPVIFTLEPTAVSFAATAITDLHQQRHIALRDWQVALIKLPHQSYSANADPILVTHDQGETKTLDETSLMIRALSDRAEHTTFLCIDSEIATKDYIQKITRALQQDYIVS